MAAPRTRPARSLDVATVDAFKGMLTKAIEGASQVIALGTAQSSSASDASMRREESLSKRYHDLQDRYDALHKELQAERIKNGDNAVALEREKNVATKAHLNRLSQKEAIEATKELTEKLTKLLTMKAVAGQLAAGASNAAPSIADRPPIESLIESLIRDLSPATLALCYGKVKHALLPLLAQKTFLVSAYNAFVSPPSTEMMAALAVDLGGGPEAYDRISAIARAAGLDQ